MEWKKLTSGQKRAWGVSAGVLGFGAMLKFAYFYVSRNMIIEGLNKTDSNANVYLKESRDFAKWSAEDREKRLPPLTTEQRNQMHTYLELLASKNNDVYPSPPAED